MTRAHPPTNTDSRVVQTRTALFRAFATLVLDRAYEEISITDIIGLAGISRSTFYQHYRNKDDILADSMSGMFGTLADAACGKATAAELNPILEHFWENRTFGRIILNGPANRRLAAELGSMIEARLDSAAHPLSPAARRLKSIELAEGCLAMIRAWLSGAVSCTVDDLSGQLLS